MVELRDAGGYRKRKNGTTVKKMKRNAKRNEREKNQELYLKRSCDKKGIKEGRS